MALLTCKECGNQVSSTATACPHCGAPVKVAAPAQAVDLKTIIVAGVMLCLVALYFHFRDSNTAENQTAAATTPTASAPPSQPQAPGIDQPSAVPIKPGNIVKFAEQEIACSERGDMVALKKLLIRGEKSKALPYFSENGDGRCLLLDNTHAYSVISVESSVADMPAYYAIMRIADTMPNSTLTAWVFAENAVVQ